VQEGGDTRIGESSLASIGNFSDTQAAHYECYCPLLPSTDLSWQQWISWKQFKSIIHQTLAPAPLLKFQIHTKVWVSGFSRRREKGDLRRTIGTVLNAAADVHWLLYDKVDRKKKYIASAGTTINSDPTVLVALTVLDICFSRKYMTVNVVFISSCFLEYSFSAAQT
jgi:hypothetical protein